MENCYEGIAIPAPIEEPCGNNYTSTSCVTTPVQFVYLDLAVGANQTQINTNLVTALQTANQLIIDLQDRVQLLENNQP